MRPAPRMLASDRLERRIDAMPMGITDRENAKAQLRSAERFVDGVFDAIAAVRSCAAFVARHVRTAIAPAPQH